MRRYDVSPSVCAQRVFAGFGRTSHRSFLCLCPRDQIIHVDAGSPPNTPLPAEGKMARAVDVRGWVWALHIPVPLAAQFLNLNNGHFCSGSQSTSVTCSSGPAGAASQQHHSRVGFRGRDDRHHRSRRKARSTHDEDRICGLSSAQACC